jgi:hypothetical protein
LTGKILPVFFCSKSCFFVKNRSKNTDLDENPGKKRLFLIEITFTFAPLTKTINHEIERNPGLDKICFQKWS